MYAEPEFETSTAEQDDHAWRDEVASRLSSYKARRRRKVEGNYSMKLDFEAEHPEAPSREAVVAAVAEKFHHDEDVADTNYYRRLNAEAAVSEPEPGPGPDFFDIDLPEEQQFLDESEPVISGDPEYSPIKLDTEPIATERAYDPANDPDFDFSSSRAAEAEPAISVGSGAAAAPAREKQEKPKVIHFPRPAGMEPPPPPPVYDFAEPVIDRPRIMDVPEDTMPTIRGPLFAEIRLDDQATDEAVAPKFQPEIDVPLQVAAVNQRVFAGLIDLLVVVVATAAFGIIAWNSLPEIPHTKEMALVAVLIPVVFWSIYQYLFIVYAGQTTGMRMAQLRLRTFDGRHPGWRERKHRALSMMLSCMSVGLGFAWSMVDEDMLCWHDKISRTYPIQER